jgi:hypothetical protein
MDGKLALEKHMVAKEERRENPRVGIKILEISASEN